MVPCPPDNQAEVRKHLVGCQKVHFGFTMPGGKFALLVQHGHLAGFQQQFENTPDLTEDGFKGSVPSGQPS